MNPTNATLSPRGSATPYAAAVNNPQYMALVTAAHTQTYTSAAVFVRPSNNTSVIYVNHHINAPSAIHRHCGQDNVDCGFTRAGSKNQIEVAFSFGFGQKSNIPSTAIRKLYDAEGSSDEAERATTSKVVTLKRGRRPSTAAYSPCTRLGGAQVASDLRTQRIVTTTGWQHADIFLVSVFDEYIAWISPRRVH
jgi:hypothetical protein